MLFAVIRYDEYHSEVRGVFTSAKRAIDAAEQGIRAERTDDWNWRVEWVGQNELSEPVQLGWWHREDRWVGMSGGQPIHAPAEVKWHEQAAIIVDPQTELTDLALAILEGDPVAVDLAQDAIAQGAR